MKHIVEKHIHAEERSSRSDDFSSLEWTEEEETILRHKMDWRTVPWVTVLYLLCVRKQQHLRRFILNK